MQIKSLWNNPATQNSYVAQENAADASPATADAFERSGHKRAGNGLSIRKLTSLAAASMACGRALAAPASLGVHQAAPLPANNLTEPFFGPYVIYNDGPVVASANVTVVHWNSDVQFQAELDAFYTDIVNSQYFGLLQEYSTPTQNITLGKFGGNVVLSESNLFVNDTDIQSALTQAVNNQVLPTNTDGNQVFMVHFPKGAVIGFGPLISCYEFISYHSSFHVNDTLVVYSVVPDQSGACSAGRVSTTSAAQLNQTTIAASHELVEAVTDPAAGTNVRLFGPPLGWLDPVDGEIADPCEGRTTNVGPWAAQQIWSVQNLACVPHTNTTN